MWGEVDMILHCGDVLRHPVTDASRHLAMEMGLLSVPLMISRGNCDRDGDQEFLSWPLMSPYVHVWWNGRRILMGHGHLFSDIRNLAEKSRPDLVVTGHTHIASLVREGNTIYLNPGSASAPRGRDPASVALVTEKYITIVTLEGAQLHIERW